MSGWSVPDPPGAALRIRTTDADTAHEILTEAFVEHALTSQTREVNFSLDAVRAESMVMSRMQFGVGVVFDAPATERTYLVNLPVAGHSALRQRGARHEAAAGRSGLIMAPSAPLTVEWDAQTVQRAIMVRRDWIESQAAKLLGRPLPDQLDFDPSFPVTGPRVTTLVESMTFAFRELTRPDGLTAMPMARQQLESSILIQMLLALPNNLTQLLTGPSRTAPRSTVADVVEYIDTHPDLRLTIADLAEFAGVGARALQIGFRERMGETPTAYLRRVRLHRVHRDLLAGVGPINEVAANWGFHHPGHFARYYRTQFGVAPSDTAGDAERREPTGRSVVDDDVQA